ncbi:hypothetical protein RHSIM_Rhsim05G0099100 [Rhododendron simsii]|uniref:Uncharacterized protein n=1 Tax=Rhododendron simsii TaxID=118357 RepID=A0A834GXY1_RHOSS|nr:hypothetical protein RHSIM_Rhsim05G0099100 [Rhododendron simsii]
MAAKSKKAEQSPFHKESTKASRSWPDLRTQLLTILARNSTLMQNISCGGNVTKSYRLPPRQCNPIGKSPFPQLSVNDNGHTDRCHDDSLPDIFNITLRMLAARGGVEPSDRYYLWDPIDRSCWGLPLWDVSVPFKHVALSSSPYDHKSICTVMVLTVMEKIDSHFRITSLGTNRAVPSVHAMHFKEYLIESKGEILLVFLVSRKSIHRVENVEVYRL